MFVNYVKEFARNYSFFQIVAYGEFSRRTNPAFNIPIDIGHPLMINRGGPLADIYYPQGGLKSVYGQFGKALADTSYFERLVAGSAVAVETIKPYFEQSKLVQDIKELKNLYELYLDFLYGESASWVAPHIEDLPQDLRAKAMSIREKTQHLSSQRDDMFDANLRRLYPELGSLVHFITPQSVFEGKPVEALRQEAERFVPGFVNFDGLFYTGDINDILKKLEIVLIDEQIDRETDELKGQTACGGCARGQVRIVLTKNENDKVKSGDILVSPITRPDFLPAMRLAGALVTDEGGITCHAAIVSRELGKPCIIGTKIATQILHDGDEVEVDADNGIVRILAKR